MRAQPTSPLDPVYLRGSNARPLEERDFRESQVTGWKALKLAQAHSSEKYKECAQTAVV